MDLNDVTPEKFFKKVTYSSDTNPENKLVLSNETFVQSILMMKLIQAIDRLERGLK